MKKMELIKKNFERNGWVVRNYIGFDGRNYIGFCRHYMVKPIEGTADEGHGFVCSFDLAEQDIPIVGIVLDRACKHVESPADFTKFRCLDEKNKYSFESAACEMKRNLEDRVKEAKEILKKGFFGYCAIGFRRVVHSIF